MSVNAPILSGSACLFLLALYNFSFWQQIINYADWPTRIGCGVLIMAIMYTLLTLFTFKYTYKPFLVFAFLVAALSAYTMDYYGYVISTEAFRNIVETDSHEAFDLMNWRLVRNLAIFFVIPTLVILWLQVRMPSLKIRTLHLVLALLLCFANIMVFNKFYLTMFRNYKHVKYYVNPIRPIYSMVKYTVLRFKPGLIKEFVELDPNPTRVATNGKPKLVVLVVGESDRAMNHQLNGYHKPTNPLLSQRKDIFSFNKFYSCGTETTVSVPCMFSAFRREEYSDHKGIYTENVLDLLHKSKVDVLWRDNDSGCKNVCNRIPTHDLNQADIKPYCNSFECHDEVLLHDLDVHINTNVADKLIILHKKGSHGPAYYKRYPDQFAKFTPTCQTNELHKCSNQELINTYDNIVLYTDYFLDKVIQHLENSNDKYQTALIYVSDHGESLGEKGVYLHAMPYWLAPKEQIHVPFMFWASADFAIDREHLAKIQQQEFSHDHLFHSLLGLFDVKTTVYAQELDMFAAG